MEPVNSTNNSASRLAPAGLLGILLIYALACATDRLPVPAEHAPDHGAISHLWAVAPFAALLGCIAVLPLVTHTSHWWEHNRNKLLVAATLAAVTLAYLALFHPEASLARAGHALQHSLLAEYVPFMVLLFSLYTISGGIRIAGDLPAHAATNSLFMLVGAVLASFIGTTGAAMLLVRPLLETNAQRKHVAHTMVFFVFVVCNAGGLLLPLGDPPLLLGYLNGVDFWWTLRLWKSWLLVNGLLIVVYFVWDQFFAHPRETSVDLARDQARVRKLQFEGVWPNALLLVGVIFAVGLLDTRKFFPGTHWTPWPYLREAVELGLVFLSLVLGSARARTANQFNYGAIVEVAALFLGIFICMQPALEILNVRGRELGLTTPEAFFWITGGLSAVLDNAPTYLVFFKAAQSMSPETGGPTAGVPEMLLQGISLGAVFMGAMTYIGNGPNFMVKAIAESAGVKMPSFFGFLVYSCAVLLPILALNVWLFL